MSIRRRKTSGIWWVDFTPPGGQRIRRSTGTKDKKQAQEFHDRLKADLWRIEQLGDKPKRSFEEACVHFLRLSEGQADYGTKIRHVQYWRDVFKGRSVCSISSDEVHNGLPTYRTYDDGRKARKLSAATKNRYLASIRRLFTLAYQAGWINRVPVLSNYREPAVRVRWISKEQAVDLISHLSTQWMKDVCEFALYTGARANEILTLEWANVDLIKSIAWVENSRAKSGKARALPLNSDAVTLLRRRQSSHRKWVFTRTTGRQADQIDARMFKRACEKSGIVDFRFHDLRHTWASWHVQAGTPLFILKEMGGWETLEMVRKYAHLDASHLAQYAIHGTFRSPLAPESKKAELQSALSA